MFQAFILAFAAIFGFSSKPVPVPAATTPSTGPGPDGRRRAIYASPAARVAQLVVHEPEPVAQPVVIQTTKPVYDRIPAARAVRRLQDDHGLSVPQADMWTVDTASAKASLGSELTAYVLLALDRGIALPSVPPNDDRPQDRAYRRRLREAMLSDLDTWEQAARERDRQRAEATEAGLIVPDAMILPDAVEHALAQRAAAKLAELKRRRDAGAAGKGGGNAVRFPPADSSKTEGIDAEVSVVSAGPK